jgi:hypothetical protein
MWNVSERLHEEVVQHLTARHPLIARHIEAAAAHVKDGASLDPYRMRHDHCVTPRPATRDPRCRS